MGNDRKSHGMRITTRIGILTILALIVLALGVFLYFYLTSPQIDIIVLPSFSKIYSIAAINNQEIAIAGVKFYNNNTLSEGVVALFYLNNKSCLVINVSKYFYGGYTYAIGYNGSTLLVGGSERINGSLHSSLIAINIDNGKIYNLSNLFSPFYDLGQVYAIAWTGKYWLVGGNAYIVYLGGQTFLVPFLIMINSTAHKDLTSLLPSEMTVLGGTSSIYSISPSNSGILVVGGNSINMTAAIFNGTNFTELKFGYLHIGVLLTSYWWNGEAIVGGENLTNPNTPQPFLGYLQGGKLIPVNLNYKIGVVSAIGSYGNELYIAIRVPFETENGTAYGTVLLQGTSFTSLHPIFQKSFVVIEDLKNVSNYEIGVGYKQQGSNYLGLIIIFR